MIMKRILNFLLIPAAVLCMGLMTASKPSADRKTDTKTPIYLNTSYSFEERAVDLVSRLTLEEKQSLIGNSMAAITWCHLITLGKLSQNFGRLHHQFPRWGKHDCLQLLHGGLQCLQHTQGKG